MSIKPAPLPSSSASHQPPSALTTVLSSHPSLPSHPPHLHALALQVLHNLQYQHDWIDLQLHTHSDFSPSSHLPRILLSGLPPSPTYVHPDEQVELLKSGKKKEREREWVLPTQVRETWSLRQFAECFDGVEEEPPVSKFVGGKVQDATGKGDMMVKEKNEGKKRRGGKRMLLATVCDDSTVVYYIIHEGIVKPRQN